MKPSQLPLVPTYIYYISHQVVLIPLTLSIYLYQPSLKVCPLDCISCPHRADVSFWCKNSKRGVQGILGVLKLNSLVFLFFFYNYLIDLIILFIYYYYNYFIFFII